MSRTSQEEGETHLTLSGLVAMDWVHCLGLYNLQTPVLSASIQKTELISKYIGEKKILKRNSTALLHHLKGDGFQMGENNIQRLAKGMRTLNKSHNMQTMKKMPMVFFGRRRREAFPEMLHWIGDTPLQAHYTI